MENPVSTTRYTARLTDDWLPVPEKMLAELGWKDGDRLDCEVVGDAVVLTLARDQTALPVRPGARVARAFGLGAYPSGGRNPEN